MFIVSTRETALLMELPIASNALDATALAAPIIAPEPRRESAKPLPALDPHLEPTPDVSTPPSIDVILELTPLISGMMVRYAVPTSAMEHPYSVVMSSSLMPSTESTIERYSSPSSPPTWCRSAYPSGRWVSGASSANEDMKALMSYSMSESSTVSSVHPFDPESRDMQREPCGSCAARQAAWEIV